MRTVIAALVATFCLGALISPAGAVGFGPLALEGATKSDRKGFYLTLINPYPTTETFQIHSIGFASEDPEKRVSIPIRHLTLGPNLQRRLLVVATRLAPGEEYKFRVCAERFDPKMEALVNARVCSKLIARRVI